MSVSIISITTRKVTKIIMREPIIIIAMVHTPPMMKGTGTS
ncbi:MAG: hypothetical protein ACLQAT_05990 [Candidatus Binataceae bacterium]